MQIFDKFNLPEFKEGRSMARWSWSWRSSATDEYLPIYALSEANMWSYMMR